MDDSPSRHRRGLPGLERLLGRRTRRWPPLSPPSPPSPLSPPSPPSPSISLISSSPELCRPSGARSNDSTSSVFSVTSHHPSTATSPQESTITAAVEGFPSVRYIPADHAPDVRWKHSDLRDVPLESHDALCHICLEDFTPPPLRDAVTTAEEEDAAVLVQLSPCGHVFHRRCAGSWLCQSYPGRCPLCRKSLVVERLASPSQSRSPHGNISMSGLLLPRLDTGGPDERIPQPDDRVHDTEHSSSAQYFHQLPSPSELPSTEPRAVPSSRRFRLLPSLRSHLSIRPAPHPLLVLPYDPSSRDQHTAPNYPSPYAAQAYNSFQPPPINIPTDQDSSPRGQNFHPSLPLPPTDYQPAPIQDPQPVTWYRNVGGRMQTPSAFETSETVNVGSYEDIDNQTPGQWSPEIVRCDGCGRDECYGVDHRCIECPSFNYCTRCISTSTIRMRHDLSHHFFPVDGPHARRIFDHVRSLLSGASAARSSALALALSAPVSLSPSARTLHTAICDSCDQRIRGVRHKCLVCDDFDFCEVCIANEQIRASHTASHAFFPIANSRNISAYAAARRQILILNIQETNSSARGARSRR